MIFISVMILSSITAISMQADSVCYPFSAVKGADMAVYDLYLYNIGRDYSKSMEYAEIFLNGLDTSLAIPEAGRICDELSSWYEHEKGSSSDAIQWKIRALKYYEANDMQRESAETMYHLAMLYYKRGAYHRTLQYTADAVSAFRRMSDEQYIAKCENLLGAVYYTCGDYENAFDHFQKYSKYAADRNDSVCMCKAFNNLALYYYYVMGDTVKAGRFYGDALKISRENKDTSGICHSLLNIASCKISYGKYEDARRYLYAVRGLLMDSGDKGQYFQNWSYILRNTGNMEDANDSIECALKYYSGGEFDLQLKQCYELMIANYEDLADTLARNRAAWMCYEVSQRLSDMETNMQLFQYQNKIIAQKEAEKIFERKATVKIYVTVFLSVMIVFGMGVLLYARNRAYMMRCKEDELEKQLLINRQNEQELRSKNEILEIKKLEKYRTEKTVLEMTEKFRNLCSEVKDSRTCAKINQICSEITNSLETEISDINNFVPEFSSDFFRMLLRKFPDLTVNERRLCALLHMNMSTKEISEITRQSPHSINIARGRLRCKLGLKGSSQTIQEFLTSFEEFNKMT